MANKVEFYFDGLAELRATLRNLPEAFAHEAQAIVHGAADRAAADIVAAYPEVTGNLKAGVSVIKRTATFGAVAFVKNKARHSHLFELGTVTRQTALGYNRGAVPKVNPPGRVFVPIAMRHRRQMFANLKAMLARVAGDLFTWHEDIAA
jgi:hypothetical protein